MTLWIQAVPSRSSTAGEFPLIPTPSALPGTLRSAPSSRFHPAVAHILPSFRTVCPHALGYARPREAGCVPRQRWERPTRARVRLHFGASVLLCACPKSPASHTARPWLGNAAGLSKPALQGSRADSCQCPHKSYPDRCRIWIDILYASHGRRALLVGLGLHITRTALGGVTVPPHPIDPPSLWSPAV